MVAGVKDAEEAIRLANETEYGLGSAIWSTNIGRLNLYHASSMRTPSSSMEWWLPIPITLSVV